VITQDCKQLRDLPSLAITHSWLWHRLQILIVMVFCNLALIAFLPYLLDQFFSYSTTIILLLLLTFNLVLIFLIKRFILFIPTEYEIACKHGVWKLTRAGQVDYARLAGDILVWQWIIIIHLKISASKQVKLVLLKDSMAPQDMAMLRRWLLSEFN
jgi:hypothetical protein